MYVGALLISLLVALCADSHGEEEYHLDIQLQFNETCASVNASGTVAVAPDPLSIELENASSVTYVVQHVMELGADANPGYKFTVTYCDRSTGYTIDVLSGLEVADDCQWYLFYQAPEKDELEYQKNARISYFVVEPNSTVVLSYESEPIVPSPQPSPSATPEPNNDNGAPPSIKIANFLVVLLCLVLGLAVFQ